jgi:arylsulfatase A-like enzyme
MKPNVLFIVIDGFRADKCYGKNKTSKTPHLDSLIKNGVYFSQAISCSDGTFTSLGGIFTSEYPFKTNVSWFKNHSKAKKHFKHLKNFSYSLHATLPDPLFFENLTTDFDNKDICSGEPYLTLFEGFGEKIINFLTSKKKSPWFYYTHIMDLHVNKPIPHEFNTDEFGQTEYDQRISSIDYWLGKFLEKIDFKNTLIVITSDHGEHIHPYNLNPEFVPTIQHNFKKINKITPSFLEPLGIKFFIFLKKFIGKYRLFKLKNNLSEEELRNFIRRGGGTLYDDVLRIPLIFSGASINSSKIISQQVSQLDIFPTIFDLLSLNCTEKNDGISLVPLLNNIHMSERVLGIENISLDPKKIGNVIGIRTSRYKYYRNRYNSIKNINLYDLKSDPGEMQNIYQNNPELIKHLEKELNTLRTLKNYSDDSKNENEKIIEFELRKLGYV